jgi:hypothetical protein
LQALEIVVVVVVFLASLIAATVTGYAARRERRSLPAAILWAAGAFGSTWIAGLLVLQLLG